VRSHDDTLSAVTGIVTGACNRLHHTICMQQQETLTYQQLPQMLHLGQLACKHTGLQPKGCKAPRFEVRAANSLETALPCPVLHNPTPTLTPPWGPVWTMFCLVIDGYGAYPSIIPINHLKLIRALIRASLPQQSNARAVSHVSTPLQARCCRHTTELRAKESFMHTCGPSPSHMHTPTHSQQALVKQHEHLVHPHNDNTSTPHTKHCKGVTVIGRQPGNQVM
jgi:hypothetical protein